MTGLSTVKVKGTLLTTYVLFSGDKTEIAGSGTNAGSAILGASGTGEEEMVFAANTNYIIKLAPAGSTTFEFLASMNEPAKWPVGN